MTNKNDYKYIDLEYIYDMADGDNDFMVEIIGNFLEAMGPNMQKLYDAIATNDRESIIFLAHKLKGSFRFVGCNREGAMMEQIEELIGSDVDISEIKKIADMVGDQFNNIQNELIQFQNSIND
ncbi:MAG: Hpt domain-containing protein [Bacteroidetes bacterium]|nr:Hpt domain-containing protein [Bacteroidota bacterium]